MSSQLRAESSNDDTKAPRLLAANHHVPWRAGGAWLGGVRHERRPRRPRMEQFETPLSSDMKRNAAWDIHMLWFCQLKEIELYVHVEENGGEEWALKKSKLI